MPRTPSWDELGYAAAQAANEKLRLDGERDRQTRTNDTLGEIRDLLREILTELKNRG